MEHCTRNDMWVVGTSHRLDSAVHGREAPRPVPAR